MTSKRMSNAEGPWRKRPWPLELVRKALHRFRLIRIAAKITDFRIGQNIAVSKNYDIRCPNRLVIGDKVSFGKNFTCETDLEMGSHILISSNVSIVGKDHPFDDRNVSVFDAPRLDASSVKIGDNVLVGYGTIIIGPLEIADGCIIGSGSVVTKDLPKDMICVGNPARPIRSRYPD
ncbi:acyltransferase [Parasphingorhabdus sp.]|uniref:acyltransferase n=1 Tax=Parasphingorhabdus sp. TaxID=2709688 RepID=UPI003D2A9C57